MDEVKSKLKTKFEKFNFINKYSNFIDSLILILSIWISSALLITYNDTIPNPNWPWHADRIILLLGVFFLVYITLDLLRPIVFVGFIIGLIYVLTILIIDVNDDARDPRKTEQKIEINGESIGKFFNFQNKNDSLYIDIKKLETKVDSLNKKIHSLDSVIQKTKVKK